MKKKRTMRIDKERCALSKLLRIMNVSMLLLLVTFFKLSASTFSEAYRISLKAKNITLKEVIVMIEEKDDITFMYNHSQLNLNKRVSLDLDNENLVEALVEILKGTGIEFKVIDNQVVLFKSEDFNTTSQQQQKRTITGTVTDSNDEPLPGVSIVIKGTTEGTVTDIDGLYTLPNVEDGAVLEFSFIGLESQEVKVNGKSTIDITMIEETTGLDQVVVVGYGTTKKASVTGSISSVKTEELTKVPSSNVTSNLAGRLPGLIVDQSNGRPGADAAELSVRGFESALLIVDGVERKFNQLDPNEIESITVLKDASAAIYGVRGGSGVIMVTTKRGKTGKPTISYNSSMSLTEATRYPEMATFKQYESLANAHRRGDEWNIFEGYITPERQIGLENGTISGTDWIKEVSRNFAPMQQHNLSVRGGNEAIKYFISGAYLDQGSRWKSGDYGFERLSITSNFDAKINDRLDISFGLGLRKEISETSPADGNSDIMDMVFAHPAFPATIPNGKNVVVNTSNAISPVASTNKSIGGYNRGTVNYETGDFGFTYKVPGIKGLVAGGKVAFVHSFVFDKRFEQTFDLWAFDGVNYIGQQTSNAGQNDLKESSYRFNRLLTNLRLDYEKKIGEHSIKALLLYESNKTESKTVNAVGNDVIASATPYLNYSNPDKRDATGFASEDGATGVVMRLNYDLRAKYLLEMIFRIDQSSRFPEETRTGYFPGVSAGWIISKENFMSDFDFLSNLKLRTSYSNLGNSGGTYSYIEGFKVSGVGAGYVFNNQFQTAIETLGEPNPYITWQETELYNVGVDVGLFKNQLTMELDAFYRNRTGLLASDPGVNIPTTSGISVPLKNVNERNNRGFELVIGHKGSKGDFKYNVSANFSWTREKYGKTLETKEYDDSDQERINLKEGNWVNRTFGYQFDGFWTEDEIADLIWNQTNDPDNYIDYGVNPNNIRAGDIRVKDFNGDGIVDGRDRIIIGRSSRPEIMFGLNSTAQWKNFDFTMFWQGAANFNQNMSGTERGLFLHASGPRTPYSYLYGKVWTPETADEAVFPADLDGKYNDATMDKYFVDSKYIRLKNLVVGYTLPSQIVSRIGLKKVRLYVSGTNLITIDNLGIYPVDPEVSGVGSYPIQRVYSFGVNVQF